MRESFRKYTAFLVLAFYVPVSLLIGLDHHHQPYYVQPPSGKHLVINKYDSHSLTTPYDGFCMACHFVQGHVPPVTFTLTTHFNVYKILASVNAFYLTCKCKHLPGKRAPPVELPIS